MLCSVAVGNRKISSVVAAAVWFAVALVDGDKVSWGLTGLGIALEVVGKCQRRKEKQF